MGSLVFENERANHGKTLSRSDRVSWSVSRFRKRMIESWENRRKGRSSREGELLGHLPSRQGLGAAEERCHVVAEGGVVGQDERGCRRAARRAARRGWWCTTLQVPTLRGGTWACQRPAHGACAGRLGGAASALPNCGGWGAAGGAHPWAGRPQLASTAPPGRRCRW